MAAAFSRHYLPWIIGFVFSILVGHAVIKPVARRLWHAIDLDPEGQQRRPSPWQPEALGLTERALFTASLLTANGAFIGVWLVLKTAAQWKSWGVDQEGSTRLRTVSGREVFVNFLLGTALSIGFAAAGAYATLLLRDRHPAPALVLMALTTIGALALGIWVERQGRVFLAKLAPRDN